MHLPQDDWDDAIPGPDCQSEKASSAGPDVTHGVLHCWRAGNWGGLGAGHQRDPGVRLATFRPIRRAASMPDALCVENSAPSGGRAP